MRSISVFWVFFFCCYILAFPPIVDGFLALGNSSTLEKVDESTVCWSYKREPNTFIAYVEMITDFTSVDFTVSSENEINLASYIQEMGNKDFIYLISGLKDSTFESFHLTPDEFKDSEGGTEKLDTTKVRQIPAFIDLQVIFNPDGSSNRVCFKTDISFKYDNMKVEEKDYTLISGELVISSSTKLTGNIVAYESRIVVNCSRFEFTGDIVMVKSEFIASDGSWIYHEQFNHEHTLTVFNHSTVDFRDGSLFTYFPYAFPIYFDSVVQFTNVVLAAGSYTVSMDGSSELHLDEVTQFGEIITPAGANLTITNSNAFLVWIQFDSHVKDTFSLPSTGEENFDTQKIPGLEQHYILVQNSKNTKYAIILSSDGYISVDDSDVLAVGMTFGPDSQTVIDGIRNGKKYDDVVIKGSKDQGIHLQKTSVQAWNFYYMDFGDDGKKAGFDGGLVIENSVFGESIVYGQGKINVTSSTCDGTGGYLGTVGTSSMLVTQSRVTTSVISKDESSMYFRDSEIVGDIFVENGKVVLENTTLVGQKIITGNGTIVVK